MDSHRNQGYTIVKEVMEYLYTNTSLTSCILFPQCYGKSLSVHVENPYMIIGENKESFLSWIENPKIKSILLESNLKVQELIDLSSFLEQTRKKYAITDFFAISSGAFSFNRASYQK